MKPKFPLMKFKVIIPAIFIIILYSCSPCKVATVVAEKLPLTATGFVFENDTVRITYHFWAYKGQMQFDIYNKTDMPIYFDWKTSAYIPNDKMVSYWQDVTNTEGVFYTSRLYGGSGVGAGKSKSTHQERIGVVPPHSMITNNQFNLVKKYSEVEQSGTYEKNNTPLRFRNYLTLCTNEKFEGKVTSVDNSFFVASIKKVSSSKVDKYKAPNTFYTTQSYSEH